MTTKFKALILLLSCVSTVTMGQCTASLSIDYASTNPNGFQCESDFGYVLLYADHSPGLNPVSYQWSCPGNCPFNSDTTEYFKVINNSHLTNNGTYSVTITYSNGCSSTAMATVNIHPSPLVSIDIIYPQCAGYTILTANDANNSAGPYSWFWPETGSTAQTIITYSQGMGSSQSCTMTNADGCYDEAFTSSLFPEGIANAWITASDTDFCRNDSVELTANIFPSYLKSGATYKWKRYGITVQDGTSPYYFAKQGGKYKVLVTEPGGCTKLSSLIHLTRFPLPDANIVPKGPTTFCPGDSVILDANTGTGLTYQWKNGNNIISGATNAFYVAKVSGNYRVIVTQQNGCSKTSPPVAVTAACRKSLSEEISDSEMIAAYPNPADDFIHFDIESSEKSCYQIKCLDITGRDFINEYVRLQEGKKTIGMDIRHLPAGVYLLLVIWSDNTWKKKLLIR